jgi:hypothetical protein
VRAAGCVSASDLAFDLAEQTLDVVFRQVEELEQVETAAAETVVPPDE